MDDVTTTDRSPCFDDVAAFVGELRSLSGRLARFEPVSADELAAFHARKRELVGER